MAEVQFNGAQAPVALAPVPLTAEPEQAAPVKRGPGRPRKNAAAPAVKRGPGRPRKNPVAVKKAKRVAGVKLQTQVHKRVEKFFTQYAKENGMKPSEATRQVLTKFAVKHGVVIDA